MDLNDEGSELDPLQGNEFFSPKNTTNFTPRIVSKSDRKVSSFGLKRPHQEADHSPFAALRIHAALSPLHQIISCLFL